MQKITQRLSAEAMDELRAIAEEEIDEVMTESEIEEIGIRVLGLFSLLMTPEPGENWIRPDEQEQKALDFIASEIEQGREPTVRGIAKAMGLESSRSGHRMLKQLMSKGWVGRREQ